VTAWERYAYSRTTQAVCTVVGVSPYVLPLPGRRQPHARCRQAIFWLLRQLTDLSYPQIGKLFDRHHTTVMHGERAFERALVEREDWACALLEVLK